MEFAVLCPILLALILASIEYGRAMQVSEVLTEGARAGARRAISLSQGNSTNSSIIAAAVVNALTMENLPAPSMTADANGVQTLIIETAGPQPSGVPPWTWKPSWTSYSDSAPPGSGYLVRVTVKANANQVSWVSGGGYFSPGANGPASTWHPFFGSNFYFQSMAVMRVP